MPELKQDQTGFSTAPPPAGAAMSIDRLGVVATRRICLILNYG